jgi:fibronectin-binding autotransporter adhesin
MHVLSGTNLLTGAVAVNTNFRLVVDAGASVEFSNATAALSGAGSFIKFGNGTAILSGVNTHTGTTNARNGVLQLEYGTNNTSKLADGAALTFGGHTGLTATGADSNVAGNTQLIGSGGGAIHLNGGSHTEVVSATTIDTGSNAVTRGTGTSILRMNVITRNNSGGTIDFGAAGIAQSDNNNVNGILGGWATVGKTNWATTVASGAADTAVNALATYGANTFTSGTNSDVTSASQAIAASTTNSLRFNAPQATTLTLNGLLQMQSGGLLVTPNVGAFNTVITGSAIQNAANTAGLEALIVHQHNTSGVLEIASVIQNNTNAQAFTKTGAGTVILSGLNTYTGAFSLFEGTLQVGGTAADPNTPTNAFLSGFGAAGNNASAWNLGEGSTLRFLTTNTSVYNTPSFNGDGRVVLAAGNLGEILFDDDNANWTGDLDLIGGTIHVNSNNNALGSVRGVVNVSDSPSFVFRDGRVLNKVFNYAEGTTFNLVNFTTTGQGAFSGRQNFNNTTTAGLVFNLPTSTGNGSLVGLNLSGVVYGSNGFTKAGNGILQISGNNFTDVYDGYTSINKTASLSGQIAVNGGVLYVGGARALGAHGVGNEVVIAPGASLDLRGQALNYGDDSDLFRKIIEISGSGLNGTGALRNSTGTAQASFLTLNANALINSGGTANSSVLVLGTFDTNLNNANALTGAFTRNRPVIDGGGFDLTIQGARVATDNFIIADPSFSSALGSLLIREGGTRLRHEISAVVTALPITNSDITNGIEIGYGGLTAGDLTGALAGTGANVGARLSFDNYWNTAHTVDITMNGALAAANNGINALEVQFFTIPQGRTFLNGSLNLTGDAMRNILVAGTTGNYTVAEQGNTTVAPVVKMVIGGEIQGTGGFTKVGFGETRLTAANTFTGDVNVLRFGSSSTPWSSYTQRINGVDYASLGLAEGWAEWGLTLNGTDGSLANVGNINLQRRGMITLDNTNRLDATSGVVGGNNNNRINDAAILNMSNGWLRINGGSVNNTETLGTVNLQQGTNIVDLYPTDGAGTNMTLTIGELNRSAGSTLRIVNMDPTSTFGLSAAGESVRVAVGTLNAPQTGGAGAADSATMSIVRGIFGGNIPLGLDTDFRLLGFNNGNVSDLWNQQRNLQFLAGSHFMTYEGGYLRPLDDDEYFTPADSILSSAVAANLNVNLTDHISVMKDNTSINALRFGPAMDHDGSGGTIHSGTTLTGEVAHSSLNLYVDGTLTINSGMISSAYFATGNTASAGTVILGGALDFAGQEAIINVQNGFYNTTFGGISGGTMELRSAITNAAGLTKTGFQQIVLDGANTYTGVTTINDGTIFLRHGRSAAGAGGAGNGIVITGSGNLNSGNGIVVGSPTAREDIYIGVLAGDNQIMRNDNDLTVWYSNLTIDNVDVAGQTIFTPRIRTDNSATSILYGNIGGGNTPVIEDVLQMDSRVVQFDAAGNNIFILRGQIGDKIDGSGNAIPIADPISLLPSLAGVRTNENEVLRVNLNGASLETNFILDRQYNAAGRLTINQGNVFVNYDPAAIGNDGTGFWTNTAISRIPGANSDANFAQNGNSSHQGITLNGGGLFLTTPGQVFNMSTWRTGGTAARFVGGINESGVVTYGDGTGTFTSVGAITSFQAQDGGTVVFASRLAGALGTGSTNYSFLKQGRGTLELQNSTAGAAGADQNFVLAGGTLHLNHTAATSVAVVGDQNARFDGGTLLATASSGANTTANIVTSNAANRVLNLSIGGNEIIARTTNQGTARNMTLNLGNANTNNNASNFVRGAGATLNLVEDQAAGGVSAITLNFNVSSTAATRDAIIPWMTYGTLARTATDFARVITSGNAVDSFTGLRAIGDFNNNVATWTASGNISENGGSGFGGTLAGPLTINSLRFDANAESIVNLGGSVLTVAAPALAQSASAILVSSNVGVVDKTITGTAGAGLTASGGTSELILHQYGGGNLNVNVPVTGSIALNITGPSSTNASTIGTTGSVVLGATNTYTGQTYINGAALSFSNANQLGTNATATAIIMNGGTLRYTGTGLHSLGAKGIRFDGNGGVIDVANGGAELILSGGIASNATYRGDLIKVGAGTLTLQGIANATFTGLADIRQGTLRLTAPNVNAGTTTNTVLGTNTGYLDGTIFRSGTNLAVQFGNLNDSGDWNIDEWFSFEGNNYVSVGTINTQTGNLATSGFPDPNNERAVNFNGLNTINGTVTFDVVSGQTARLNNGGTLTTRGNGDIIKDGQGTLELRGHNADWTGNLTVMQGRLMGLGQADVLGTGYLTGKTITLGSADRQGIAEIAINSESAVNGWTIELNHDINVVYNPAQTKRLTFETMANGGTNLINGNITLNDNLQVYINDAAENGGSQNYVQLIGQLRDGVTTSGNLILTGDEADGTANNSTSGRTYNYLVIKSDSSLWTGDVRINTNTGYDQDQTAILRLEHANALTAVNDVDMGFNSILQIGGGARTIGALSTNGGVGPFIGGNAGGTMGASTNGSTEIIENAASTVGTLTITQSTPATTETLWDAHFRDGTINSQFFAPGAGPLASAALNVVKAGNGWATMTLANSYTGTTEVTGGVLQVGRLGVGDTGAAGISGTRFTANVGTTVAGTGLIRGNALINGNLRPGDEAGSAMGMLFVEGNLTLGATSVTTLQAQRASFTAGNIRSIYDAGYGSWANSLVSGSDAIYSHLLNDPILASQHDKLIMGGGLIMTSGGKLVLANLGYNPTAGDVFNLLDWSGGNLGLTLGGITSNGGTFRTGAESGTDLDLFELGNGFVWDVSQFNTSGVLIVARAENRLFYWSGDVDGNWNTNSGGNTNWTDAAGGGADPGNLPAFTDDVNFTATAAGNFTTTLGADFTIRSLTLGGGANASNSVTIDTGANDLTLYGGGLTQVTGSAANTISGTGGIILAVDQTWTNDSTNSLTVSAPVSGDADLTKAGTGTVVLSGANTYTGETTVSTGTLSVGHATGLGSTAAGTTVSDGATLNANNVTVAENVTISGNGVGSAGALTGTGTAGVSGTVTLAANSAVGANGTDTLTLSGVVSGTGMNLAKVGTGTVILTAANTYSGTTTVTAGTLQLGDGGTTGTLNTASSITVDTGATFAVDRSNAVVQGTDFSGAAITGGGGFTQAGTGTTTLNAANTYTGATNVDAGMLMINGDQSGATGAVSVASGATLGGSGTIGGNTTIASGGTITAGNDGSSGTIGVAGL